MRAVYAPVFGPGPRSRQRSGKARGIGQAANGQISLEQEPLGSLPSSALKLLMNRQSDHLKELHFQAAPRDEQEGNQVVDSNGLTRVVECSFAIATWQRDFPSSNFGSD
jgi:hypothetical protein